MVPQLTDRVNLQAASLIAAATAGCGVFGIAYGALVDRWDTRHTCGSPLL